MTPKQLAEWGQAIGGRKFILSMGAGIISSVLLAFGVLSSSDYVLVVLGTVGAFIAGNSWQARGEAKALGEAQARSDSEEAYNIGATQGQDCPSETRYYASRGYKE